MDEVDEARYRTTTKASARCSASILSCQCQADSQFVLAVLDFSEDIPRAGKMNGRAHRGSNPAGRWRQKVVATLAACLVGSRGLSLFMPDGVQRLGQRHRMADPRGQVGSRGAKV